MSLRAASLLVALILLSCRTANVPSVETKPVCSPGILPGTPAADDIAAVGAQQTFDTLSWQTFTYLNNAHTGGTPVWSNWSSSVDLLAPVEAGKPPPPFGQHYYPHPCRKIKHHKDYRVIAQVNKVNDSLFEADRWGISGNPLIDSNGNFLRYEILLSKATYDDIVDKGYYTAAGQAGGVNLICAGETNNGHGDPSSGAMNIKLAWMEDPSDGTDPSYYSEQLLIYTPAALTSDGKATCTLDYYRLVGKHVVRKLLTQQAWFWSTFEHVDNAPGCTEAPPPADKKGLPNTSCPPHSATAYNFMPSAATCAGGACASCNSAPAENCSTALGYCVDKGPAAAAGYSSLCRQVSRHYHHTAIDTACREQVADTVWANYKLVGNQWFGGAFPSTCKNSSGRVWDGTKVLWRQINPKVAMKSGPAVPFLANTSMESYERSNCMGCHSKAVQAGTGTGGTPGPSTDFVYYLELEVASNQ